MKPYDYDVAIIGGGMVGLSLALALSSDGAVDQPQARQAARLRIALIERHPLSQDPQAPLQPSFDARATVLSQGSRQIYQALGLWDDLAPGVTAIEQIEVSSQGQFGMAHLDCHEAGVDAFGYVIENRALGRALLAAAGRYPNIELLAPAEVTALRPVPGGMRLALTDQAGSREISAALAVIADGGRSGLREALGIASRRHPYPQHALIANLVTSEPHHGIAFERFTPQGPIALLPLSEGRSALIWTLPEDEIDTLLQCDQADFIARLQQCFGLRLGMIQRIGERHHYPLERIEAMEQIRSSLVLLGNAAHSLHPVAGQSFNLSLRDAASLAAVLFDAWQNGQPLGALATLQPYLAARRRDQQQIVALSHQLPQLFGQAPFWLRAGRSLGLLAFDLCPAAKNQFTRFTMGLHQPNPALAMQQLGVSP